MCKSCWWWWDALYFFHLTKLNQSINLYPVQKKVDSKYDSINSNDKKQQKAYTMVSQEQLFESFLFKRNIMVQSMWYIYLQLLLQGIFCLFFSEWRSVWNCELVTIQYLHVRLPVIISVFPTIFLSPDILSIPEKSVTQQRSVTARHRNNNRISTAYQQLDFT